MNDLTDIRSVRIRMLPNGTCISQDLYDEFRREVEDALTWLPFGVTCRIDQLVTPKFWLPKRHALQPSARSMPRALGQ